ncbi:MAG: chromosome segregation protein SMC, partial [Candidatus Binatia bacterium]
TRADALEESLRERSMERVALDKDGERVRESLSRTRGQADRLRQEASALEEEIAALGADVAAAQAAIAETGDDRRRRDEERRALETGLSARRDAVESRSRATTEIRVELARVLEKEESLRDGLARVESQSGELDQRLADLEGESESLAHRAGARTEERQALRVALEANRGEETRIAAAFEESRARTSALREAIDRAETQLAAGRAELDRIRSERSERDLAYAEKSMRRDHVESAIAERYQLTLAEVTREPGEEAELEARVQELQGKVDRIDRSQVGIEAAGELAEAEQRRDFLVTQKADLEASVADLQKTIASLNRASRDRFAETFAAVNEKFQETFPKLFRGGRGRLVFTDESNLLETGVDIQVQPPGMNLRTLSLLSGGQKALTAVSLIFSLFLHRPSPFCVLDEVDAPLDDANIDRFNQMVREMGEESQFLLITHNKRTMEVAETLYGVTMEEPGVSKIVSVRFQRAA